MNNYCNKLIVKNTHYKFNKTVNKKIVIGQNLIFKLNFKKNKNLKNLIIFINGNFFVQFNLFFYCLFTF